MPDDSGALLEEIGRLRVLAVYLNAHLERADYSRGVGQPYRRRRCDSPYRTADSLSESRLPFWHCGVVYMPAVCGMMWPQCCDMKRCAIPILPLDSSHVGDHVGGWFRGSHCPEVGPRPPSDRQRHGATDLHRRRAPGERSADEAVDVQCRNLSEGQPEPQIDDSAETSVEDSTRADEALDESVRLVMINF